MSHSLEEQEEISNSFDKIVNRKSKDQRTVNSKLWAGVIAIVIGVIIIGIYLYLRKNGKLPAAKAEVPGVAVPIKLPGTQ